MNAQKRTLHDALLRKLVDEGRLIEGGFQAMRIAVISPDAPELQVAEMRLAYMAGAQHLFASLMGIIAPEGEPTQTDMTRMAMISNELEVFAEELRARINGHG